MKKTISMLLMISLLILSFVNAENYLTNMWANYNMSSLADSSGNDRNLTLTNNLTSDVEGKLGTSYYNGGGNNYVLYPNTFPDTASDYYSVQFWFHPNSTSAFEPLWMVRDVSGNNGYSIILDNQNLFFRLNGLGVDITCNNTITANNWYHVVYTKDTTNPKHFMYLNGELCVQINNTAALSSLNQRGFFSNFQSIGLIGMIDEITLWSGRILNSSEVVDLYNSGNGCNPVNNPTGCSAPAPPTCAVCNSTCSPCGGGCTATDLTDMYNGYDFVTDSSGIGDITNWDTSCVTDMNGLFKNSNFNQDISNWNTSNVVDMSQMFANNIVFNQAVNSWDVGKVNDFSYMFASSGFDMPLNNWNTEKATTMSYMFNDCPFNQPLNSWNVEKVTDFSYMFRFSPFNQDISGWNTASATDYSYMFEGNIDFNQNVGSWNIINVTSTTGMFINSNLTYTNYDALINGWANQENENTTMDFPSGLTIDAGSSMYSAVSQDNREGYLVNIKGWTFNDGGLYTPPVCTPDWSCNGYATCIVNEQLCNSVEDLNTCGDSYLGNYSEFTPQSCTPITGYVPLHASSDIPNVVIDFLVEFGVQIITFVGLIALGALYLWFKGRVNLK